jgi:hypothetical protein
VVELEAAQVRARDPDQADADELVGEVGDIGVESNNLLVDVGAVPSGLAAEDEEDRFAGPLRLRQGPSVVVEPAELGRVRPPRPLCQQQGRQARQAQDQEERRKESPHESHLRRN